MSVDLDDTRNCPVAQVCQRCGRADRTCQVVTTESQVGVACLTICDSWYEIGIGRRVSIVAAFEAVAMHCGHLGITLDEMAALIEAETSKSIDI